MDYNKTINLPKTDFPMRAGLPKREPDMLQHWNDLDLYNELLKKNEGKPLFSGSRLGKLTGVLIQRLLAALVVQQGIDGRPH